ncbi:serpentine type 7TM GPCR chemoreceptor srd domain-containing protein [Ditylenchus destructor]|nr:serpentine type 7TM GPCR chemoreceptor srd domain-containing protein [Ditylenchus destructor]
MTGDGYLIIASSGFFADKSRFFDSSILMIFFFVLHTNILWIPVQFVYRYRLLCKGRDGSTVGTALVISTIAVLYSMFAAFVIWYMFVTPVDFQLVGVHRVLDPNFWPRSPDATYPFMFGSFITHSRTISWLLLWTTTCLSSIFIVIWCEKSIVKHFQQFGHLMNKNTQKMHKEFHRALLAMAICPLITTTGPVLYFMTTISLQLNPVIPDDFRFLFRSDDVRRDVHHTVQSSDDHIFREVLSSCSSSIGIMWMWTKSNHSINNNGINTNREPTSRNCADREPAADTSLEEKVK